VLLCLGIGTALAARLPGVVAPMVVALGSVAAAWAVARVASDVAVPRLVGGVFCVACALATLLIVWRLGNPNIALLGAILWLLTALGIAFDVVAYRTVYYLPTFTAGVALMILWKALYNPETGPINAALNAVFGALHVGVKPPEWLASVAWAKPALIIMGVWTGIGGTTMLLYLAGLSSVPSELLDAADVDGATTWQRFRHVTWPQLAPTTFFISVMSIIGGLQGGFDQARVMTGGGPAGSTTTLSFYIYNKAFQDLDLGYAAAISWVLFAIIFVATALNWRFGRELEVGP
jgi:multiple sugar transport system permease protein